MSLNGKVRVCLANAAGTPAEVEVVATAAEAWAAKREITQGC